jgi:RNA polymerase sigma-70 factor (ECF subfamily)
MRRGDTLLGMVTAVASEAGIEQLLWMMNPEKIAALAEVTK